MHSKAVFMLAGLLLLATACGSIGGGAQTPTSPIVVPPTNTPAPIGPTVTLAVSTPVTGSVPLPTVVTTPGAPGGVVVASNESVGPVATALLTAVRLVPGHKYQLVVSSPQGKTAFYGEWSSSAVGADGLPGAKVGTLDGVTPITYDIVPPVKTVARDWLYSVSVHNKGAGGIRVTVLDVTGI